MLVKYGNGPAGGMISAPEQLSLAGAAWRRETNPGRRATKPIHTANRTIIKKHLPVGLHIRAHSSKPRNNPTAAAESFGVVRQTTRTLLPRTAKQPGGWRTQMHTDHQVRKPE